MAGTKLTHTEVDERVNKCFDLRYKSDPPIQQKKWVKYCHETFGDKSERQYIQYWISARQIVKYTGNDIEKIEARIEGNIELIWGDQDQLNQITGDEK